MTLKELFLSVDFDHVWPFVQTISRSEMVGYAIRLKQAYDEIRLIKTETEINKRQNRYNLRAITFITQSDADWKEYNSLCQDVVSVHTNRTSIKHCPFKN